MPPQIVFMTGCSAGIGLALVQRLAQDPNQRFIVIATVIAMSEKNDLEAAVKDEIGSKVFIKELDITKDDNITEIVKDVIDTHGRIDVLVNVAGCCVYDVPERVSREKMDQIFNVNLIGTIRLTQSVLPHMKRKRSGKIITLSSMAGRIGFPYSEFYCASKFAIEGFFEALATGLRAFKVRVCLVEPRQVDTDMWERTKNQMKSCADDETLDNIDRRQTRTAHAGALVGEVLTIDDVVEAVMTRCIDVDEPALRHLLAGGAHDLVQETAADLTGETRIATFGYKDVE